MPFGLKGAPGTFQKLMGVVFEELKNEGVVSMYLDDIILPSENWECMMYDLRRVLSVLRAANLTLKPSKCTFGARELDYLGFRISEGTVKPGRKVLVFAKFRVRMTHTRCDDFWVWPTTSGGSNKIRVNCGSAYTFNQ